MKRKVSIIVPLYKSEKYIEKLIESILKQSYKNTADQIKTDDKISVIESPFEN